MSGHLDVMVGVALGIVVVTMASWVLSVVLRNAGIGETVWGAGFVVIVWIARAVGVGNTDRVDLLTAMITIWGARLTLHLLWHNRGRGESEQYQTMRERQGERFASRSLATVFGIQGCIMFVVSLPVQLAATPTAPGIGWLAVAGTAIWGVGLFFETVSDTQLARFRADHGNDGNVMDRGLWRFTRHPNHFGDLCIWWGIFLVAAEATDARIGLIGPILMSFILINGRRVAALERGLITRLDGYAEYVERTPAFFPRLPRTRTSTEQGKHD